MLAGPVTLAVCGLLSAIFLHWTSVHLIGPMASSVVGTPLELDLHLFPTAIKINLILSIITVAIGFLLFLRLSVLRAVMTRILEAIGWGPDHGFDQFMTGIVRLSHRITRVLQPGQMDVYLKIAFGATAIALLLPMLAFGELPSWPEMPDMRFYEWGIMAIAVIGLIAVLTANNRLTAIAALGIQGFAVALLFMLFGAPDLSFTQFMVETLSVVILALVMTRLSLYQSDHRPMGKTIVDGAIAICVGGGFFLVLLAVSQQPFNSELSDFFREHSVAIAHGRNIVNVILVDFRGVDTLGEISVVAIAGLAILALVRIKKSRKPTDEGNPTKGEEAAA